MSLRAVAIRDETCKRLQVTSRQVRPHPTFWIRFADDRELVGLKLVVLVLLVLVAVVLEVAL